MPNAATVGTSSASQSMTAADDEVRRLLGVSRKGPSREIAALNGARGLAILLVLTHHLYLWQFGRGYGPGVVMELATFAYSGVLLFFVLSGFLLYLPYARATLDGSQRWPDVRRFYARRTLRILPVHWAILGAMALMLAVFWHLRPQTLRGITLTGLLVQNLDPDAGRVEAILNAPLWTLAVEWQFYLVLPWLALALRWVSGLKHRSVGNGKNGNSMSMLLAGIGLLLAYGLVTHATLGAISAQNPQADPAGASTLSGLLIRLFTGRYYEFFGLGMFLSVLYARFIEQAEPADSHPALSNALAVTGIIGLVGCLLWANASSFFQLSNPWDYAPPREWLWNALGIWCVGVCYASLIGAALVGQGTARRIFAFRPLCFVGLISYSMYILHMPLIEFVWNTSLPWHMAIALLLIFVASVTAYYLIERPFMRLRFAMRDTPAFRHSVTQVA